MDIPAPGNGGVASWIFRHLRVALASVRLYLRCCRVHSSGAATELLPPRVGINIDIHSCATLDIQSLIATGCYQAICGRRVGVALSEGKPDESAEYPPEVQAAL